VNLWKYVDKKGTNRYNNGYERRFMQTVYENGYQVHSHRKGDEAMQAWSISDIGKKRRENQDCTYVKIDHQKKIALLAVCDGMGGVNGGAEASRLAIEIFTDFIWDCVQADTSDEEAVLLLRNAVTAANRAVFDRGISDPAFMGMGTTLTAALVLDKDCFVVNVGDSRTYKLEDDLRQVTDDHSVAADLLRNGTISREQYERYPEKNIITRAVGTDPEVYGDIYKLYMKEKEALLLCSDGLTNMVDDQKIAEIMTEEHTPEEICTGLVAAANEAGGKDNISVVVFID